MKNVNVTAGPGWSVLVCALLLCVGLVRLVSYSRGAFSNLVCGSAIGFLCYDPASLLNAQFFKIVSTPTIIAGIYFFFRWRNAGRPGGRFDERLDFKSPLLRGILTTTITLHWFALEWWKFNAEHFYPWSPLEGRWVNVAVLVASQLLAFWGMKYLSFDPIFRGKQGRK